MIIKYLKVLWYLTQDEAYVKWIQKNLNVSTMICDGKWIFSCNQCTQEWEYNPGEMKWGWLMIKVHFPHEEEPALA